jgi:hypothetical protein
MHVFHPASCAETKPSGRAPCPDLQSSRVSREEGPSSERPGARTTIPALDTTE